MVPSNRQSIHQETLAMADARVKLLQRMDESGSKAEGTVLATPGEPLLACIEGILSRC